MDGQVDTQSPGGEEGRAADRNMWGGGGCLDAQPWLPTVLGDQAGVSCQPGGGGQLVGWVGRCVNGWTNEWTRGQMDMPSGLGIAG